MIIKLLADVYEAFAGSVRIAGIGLRTLDEAPTTLYSTTGFLF